MAQPTVIRGRFFQRVSDSTWLGRVDTQSPLSIAEAELHCAAEYGFPVRVVEVNLPAADWDTLVAQRTVGAVKPPPQPPTKEQLVEQARVKAVDDAAIALVESFAPGRSPTEKADMKAKALNFLAKAQGR